MEKRRPIERKLAATLILALCAYHLLNVLSLRSYKRPYKLTWNSLALHIKETTHSVSVPALEKNAESLDLTSGEMFKLGNLLRFSFGQIREDILLGKKETPQWIFLRKEMDLQFPRSPQWIEDHYLKQLRAFLKDLEAKGVTVVLVPVPTKIAIAREHVEAKPWTEGDLSKFQNVSEDFYGNYRKIVDGFGSETVDLYSIFSRYKAEHPAEFLYLPSDTHWSSLGISLAAQAVIRNLELRGKLSSTPVFKLEGEYPPSSHGDLLSLFEMPDFFYRWSNRFVYSQPLYGWKDQGTRPAVRLARWLLAGTSYSMINSGTPYSLGAMLTSFLGMPLVEATGYGSMTGAPGLEQLKVSNYRVRQGDVLVLEFPMRIPWPSDYEFPRFESEPVEDRSVASVKKPT